MERHAKRENVGQVGTLDRVLVLIVEVEGLGRGVWKPARFNLIAYNRCLIQTEIRQFQFGRFRLNPNSNRPQVVCSDVPLFGCDESLADLRDHLEDVDFGNEYVMLAIVLDNVSEAFVITLFSDHMDFVCDERFHVVDDVSVPELTKDLILAAQF